MAVFWVIQASVSGDVNSWRGMWASVAISWVTGVPGARETSQDLRCQAASLFSR
jgi:hypothetical protein